MCMLDSNSIPPTLLFDLCISVKVDRESDVLEGDIDTAMTSAAKISGAYYRVLYLTDMRMEPLKAPRTPKTTRIETHIINKDSPRAEPARKKQPLTSSKKGLSYCSILALICAKSGPIVRQPIATNNRQAAISTDSSQNPEFETR